VTECSLQLKVSFTTRIGDILRNGKVQKIELSPRRALTPINYDLC